MTTDLQDKSRYAGTIVFHGMDEGICAGPDARQQRVVCTVEFNARIRILFRRLPQ
jgi:hypothetical protein